MAPTLTHPNGKQITVAEEKAERFVENGWTLDDAADVSEHEIVFPDPEKANHDAIDEFARDHGVTFEGIEAKDAEKPTRAEKVAHLHKVIAARADETD
jgi:hypothetical protein